MHGTLYIPARRTSQRANLRSVSASYAARVCRAHLLAAQQKLMCRPGAHNLSECSTACAQTAPSHDRTFGDLKDQPGCMQLQLHSETWIPRAAPKTSKAPGAAGSLAQVQEQSSSCRASCNQHKGSLSARV